MSDKKKILIVEDSKEFRKSLRWILEPKGFEVTEAESGEEAKTHISSSIFDLIISDLRMPKLDGIQLHQWMKETNKNTPFIVMTGHGNISNTQIAHEHGMQGFIPKPFTKEEVLESVELILKNLSDVHVENHQEYCRIPLSHFLVEQTFPFNVYIRTAENKYIKIAHRGEDLDVERMEGFKKRGVQDLYILKVNFLQHLGFSLSIAKGVKDSDQVSRKKKQAFVTRLGESIAEYVHREEIDEESFQIAKEYVETAVSVILESEDMFEVLTLLRGHSDGLYAHSVAVSTYCVLICRELGWLAPSTLCKVAIGGLLHDVGKKEIDPNLVRKPYTKLSHPELKVVESHVIRGVEILLRVRSVSGDIIQMVHHHHEWVSGGGYPQGLKGDQIFKLAKVVSVANQFCNFAISGAGKGDYPLAALSKMLLFEDRFDHEMVLALCRVFQVQYDLIKKKLS